MKEYIERLRLAWDKHRREFDSHMAAMIVRWELRRISGMVEYQRKEGT